MEELVKIFPSISRTFAFTIPKLLEPIQGDMLISYAIFRLIDTIEDSSLSNILKKKAMNVFMEALREGKKINMPVIPTAKNYAKLIEYAPSLLEVFHSLPPDIKNHILMVADEMVKGFSDSNVQEINTIEDQNIYCYYAAGIIGELITKIFCSRGVISESLYEKLMPLSKDFGLALQKVNIIKDVRKDFLEGRYYWPKELLDRHALTHKTLLENKIKAAEVLEDLKEDVKKYVELAVNYIDLLPHYPKGLRVFCSDNLLMAIATLRDVDVRVFDGEVKISKEEVYEIDKKVNQIVKDKGNINDFAKLVWKSKVL